MPSHSESELAFLSIERAAALLRRREISPAELLDAALARIERLNPALNAFLTVVGERARPQALRAGKELRGGLGRGPLHGIPVSIKDNFGTRGIRTTAGSTILENFVPAEDSDVVVSLARAGSVLLGKTNMHEFAYGITSENPHFGPVHNPWRRERISGGSSGGSAAAVATGMGIASVGTDTGGSIRVPAALCGIVGLKPTFGLVSLEGVVPLGRSFDHVGPLARSVADACIMLEAIAGKYPKGAARPAYRKLGRKGALQIRLGWPKEYFFEKVDSEVRRSIEAAAKHFASIGARIIDVSLPRLAGAIDEAANMVVAEANHYHESQGYYPARAGEYGEDVRRRLAWGHDLRAVDYLRAVERRAEIEGDFAAVFEKVDAILAPASAIPAPTIGQDEIQIDGKKEAVRAMLLRANRPSNLTGCPAISIPCGFTCEGLPVGLQLIGAKWNEARLLAIAHAYEQSTDWHTRRPVCD